MVGQVNVDGTTLYILNNGAAVEKRFSNIIEEEVEAQETAAEEVADETGEVVEFPDRIGERIEELKTEVKELEGNTPSIIEAAKNRSAKNLISDIQDQEDFDELVRDLVKLNKDGRITDVESVLLIAMFEAESGSVM